MEHRQLRHAAIVAAIFVGLSATSASAATLVLGAGNATACFENALSHNSNQATIRGCDAALSDAGLTRRDRAASHVNRGNLRHLHDDDDGALEDFQAALRLQPALGEAYSNLALVYARRRQWAQAVEALDQGIALEPSRLHRSYYSRGVAREHLGDLAGAYEDYQQAAELAPDWAAPRTELERFTVRIERADES